MSADAEAPDKIAGHEVAGHEVAGGDVAGADRRGARISRTGSPDAIRIRRGDLVGAAGTGTARPATARRYATTGQGQAGAST